MNRYGCSFLLLIISILSAQTNTLLWKAEFNDDVKKIQPVRDGKYIFLWSDENAWLCENASGRKVWSVAIEEYSKSALHQVVNDSLYVAANEDTLLCYSMIENRLIWKKAYQGIRQDRFSEHKVTDTTFILSYTDVDLGISLLSGKELWRTPVEYQRSLNERGTVSSIVLDKQGKYLVFSENDECILLSSVTGKKLLTVPASEPNGDLIKQKRAWFYVTADQRHAALMFEKNVAVIDIDSNRIIAQIPVDISDQYNIFIPTPLGCAVLGEEKLVHINFSAGRTAETAIDIDDMRNVVFARTDSSAVLLISQENDLLCLNVDNGKLLWRSAPKNPAANGFIHRSVAADSDAVIVTYLDPSDDLKLYLMNIDLLTGKVNYRTFVAHADESLPKRAFPLPAVSSVTATTPVTFGFDNAGFAYDVSSAENNIRFLIHTSSEMIEPNTVKAGGEGIVLVDRKSGSVIRKHYMKIAQGLSFDGGLSALAPPMKIGNILLLPGNKNLVALDAETGALKWMHIEEEFNGSYVFDMHMIDSVLYLRTGGFRQTFSYDDKKEKLTDKKLWEDDGYMLMAVDTADGKIHWKKEFRSDPGRIFHDYSIQNYSTTGGQLLYGDKDFLYSLSPAGRGKLNWKFEFSDSGIGTMAYDDIFRPSVSWSGERTLWSGLSEFKQDEVIPLRYTVAVEETMMTVVSKVLHVNFDRPNDKLIVVGEDGIASVDTKSGKRGWHHEWEYSGKAVHHRPVILKENLFYFVDGSAVLLNINTGKIVWKTELDKENSLFIMPDRSSIIAVHKDEVNGLVIP